MFVVAALWGSFAFPLYSLAIAHANDFAEPGEFVQVSSGLLLAYAGGAVAGPMLAAVAVESFGVNALFAFTSLVHVVLVIFVVIRMRSRAATPEAEHVQFVEALVAAQTVSPIFDESTQKHLEDDGVST